MKKLLLSIVFATIVTPAFADLDTGDPKNPHVYNWEELSDNKNWTFDSNSPTLVKTNDGIPIVVGYFRNKEKPNTIVDVGLNPKFCTTHGKLYIRSDDGGVSVQEWSRQDWQKHKPWNVNDEMSMSLCFWYLNQ